MSANAFDNLVAACLSRARRTLKTPALLVAIVHNPLGFQVRCAFEGMSRSEVQAVALDLLRHLRDDIDAGDGCPACQARLTHLTVAIAALEPDTPSNLQAVH